MKADVALRLIRQEIDAIENLEKFIFPINFSTI